MSDFRLPGLEPEEDDGDCLPGTRGAFDLGDPAHLRAEMARAGLAPMQTRPYDDPEHGYTDPLDNDEMRTIMRRFLGSVWRACERAEAASGGNTA